MNNKATKRVPELKGIPISLTIKTSALAKKAIVKGNNNLKINNKTATTTTFAITKFLMVMFL